MIKAVGIDITELSSWRNSGFYKRLSHLVWK